MPLTQDTAAPPGKKQPLHPDDVRMSFGEHLEELRKRLIYALIGVAVGATVTFYFGLSIIAWLEQPLHRAQVVTGQSPRTVTFQVQGAFGMYMKVSLVAAVVLVMPWVVYQLWKFVSAGLYPHERRIAYFLAPFSATMTALGVLFAYYMLLPVTLVFFLYFANTYQSPSGDKPSLFEMLTAVVSPSASATTEPGPVEVDAGEALKEIPMLGADPENPAPGQLWLNRGDGTLRLFDGEKTLSFLSNRGGALEVMPDIQEYMSLVMYVMLGVVVAFQLPVVMTIAGWSGVMDPASLTRMRKYAVFVIFTLAAVLTPADVLSMFVLAAPMLLLYELGLVLMRRAYRQREV